MAASEDSIADFVNELEQALKSGGLGALSAKLDRLPLKSIPRQYRRDLSNICRRANKIHRGLKILRPVVDLPDASAEERIEYAFGLNEAGAYTQAAGWVADLPEDDFPEIHLLRVQGLFADWNYRQAIPELEKYLASSKLDTYRRTIGELNLAAAWNYVGDYKKVRHHLACVRESAEAENWLYLMSNSYELESQVLLEEGEFQRAEELLDRARDLYRSQRLVGAHYVDKWKSVIQARRTNSVEPIQKFKREAEASGHYETVRSLDFQALKIQSNQDTLDRLYFGSPFESFRKIVEQNLGSPSSTYIHGPGDLVLDIEKAELQERPIFRTGSSSHRLLRVLCQDLYRPQRVGVIFSRLFADEAFDIASSPNRVRQLLFRTRRELEKQNIDLQIVESEDCYSLVLGSSVALLLRTESVSSSPKTRDLDLLRASFEAEAFTAAEASRELSSQSRSSVNRLLRWAVEEKLLQRRGAGSGIRYFFDS